MKELQTLHNFIIIDKFDAIDFYLESSRSEIIHYHFTRTDIEKVYDVEVKINTGKPTSQDQEILLTIILNNFTINEFYR